MYGICRMSTTTKSISLRDFKGIGGMGFFGRASIGPLRQPSRFELSNIYFNEVFMQIQLFEICRPFTFLSSASGLCDHLKILFRYNTNCVGGEYRPPSAIHSINLSHQFCTMLSVGKYFPFISPGYNGVQTIYFFHLNHDIKFTG